LDKDGAVYSVELENVTKIFDESTVAMKNVSLKVKKGEFFSILGPSGCGKTTTLRIIGGFETPNEGTVRIDGRRVNNLPPNRRPVNMVFQNYALFPHLSVFENIAFPLRLKKMTESEIREKVEYMVELVKLKGQERKFPRQLSGGQKQRVALARALVNEPRVLLLDEPLSSLDAKLRQYMLMELDRIHDEVGITFIYVTHDQAEAMSVSDEIAVMNNGVIEQVGTPPEIYESPANTFVAGFIGETNFFVGKVVDVSSEYLKVETRFGILTCYKDKEAKIGDTVEFMIRPEKVYVTKNYPPQNMNFLRGKVDQLIYLGSHTKYYIMVENTLIRSIKQHTRYWMDESTISWDDEVYVWWNPDDSYLIKVTGG